MRPESHWTEGIEELELRFNGPVPEPLRRAARYGSAMRLAVLEAEGQSAFFRAMTFGQIEIIRRRRREGSFYPTLLTDLGLYRERWRYWRQTAQARRESLDAEPAWEPQLVAAE